MRVRRGMLYALMLAAGLIIAFPFFWMLSTSLKSESEATRFPPTLLPGEWLFGNYPAALAAAPFGRYFLNSGIMAVGQVLLGLATASLAAYALARMRVPGRSIIFGRVARHPRHPTRGDAHPELHRHAAARLVQHLSRAHRALRRVGLQRVPAAAGVPAAYGRIAHGGAAGSCPLRPHAAPVHPGHRADRHPRLTREGAHGRATCLIGSHRTA